VDEVWLYGDRISNGMAAEIALAYRYNIPVKVMSEELRKDDSIQACINDLYAGV
jgi:hypothetical protein